MNIGDACIQAKDPDMMEHFLQHSTQQNCSMHPTLNLLHYPTSDLLHVMLCVTSTCIRGGHIRCWCNNACQVVSDVAPLHRHTTVHFLNQTSSEGIPNQFARHMYCSFCAKKMVSMEPHLITAVFNHCFDCSHHKV